MKKSIILVNKVMAGYVLAMTILSLSTTTPLVQGIEVPQSYLRDKNVVVHQENENNGIIQDLDQNKNTVLQQQRFVTTTTVEKDMEHELVDRQLVTKDDDDNEMFKVFALRGKINSGLVTFQNLRYDSTTTVVTGNLFFSEVEEIFNLIVELITEIITVIFQILEILLTIPLRLLQIAYDIFIIIVEGILGTIQAIFDVILNTRRLRERKTLKLFDNFNRLGVQKVLNTDLELFELVDPSFRKIKNIMTTGKDGLVTLDETCQKINENKYFMNNSDELAQGSVVQLVSSVAGAIEDMI